MKADPETRALVEHAIVQLKLLGVHTDAAYLTQVLELDTSTTDRTWANVRRAAVRRVREAKERAR